MKVDIRKSDEYKVEIWQVLWMIVNAGNVIIGIAGYMVLIHLIQKILKPGLIMNILLLPVYILMTVSLAGIIAISIFFAFDAVGIEIIINDEGVDHGE